MAAWKKKIKRKLITNVGAYFYSLPVAPLMDVACKHIYIFIYMIILDTLDCSTTLTNAIVVNI